MCPTLMGRIHTRVAVITLPALLALILTLVTGDGDWLLLVGLYLLLGIFLDIVLYSWVLRYQPPWMTFVLAVGEFVLLYVLVVTLDDLNQLTTLGIVIFYWVSWVLAVWTKVAILPILSLTYLESAGEFRHPEWSVPPSQESLPIVAKVASAQAPAVAGAGAVAAGAHDGHAEAAERASGEPLPQRIADELDATLASAQPPFRTASARRSRASAARSFGMTAWCYLAIVGTAAGVIVYTGLA